MFDSPIFDVVLGLIFVFLILSIVCSGIQEWIAGILKLRSHNLKSGIENLLTNDIATEVYKHGLIKGLAKPNKYPSYIPSKTFTTALIDIVAQKGGPAADARKMVADSKVPEPLKGALLALANDAEGKVEEFKASVASWYDDAMDRVSGWYGRKAQVFLAIIAAVVTLLINADSIKIAGTIWTNQTLRGQLVAMGISVTRDQPASQTGPVVSQKQIEDTLNAVPIGYKCPGSDAVDCISANVRPTSLVGWAITIVAVSFGAPFWFDLLNKVARLKTSGDEPKKKEEEV